MNPLTDLPDDVPEHPSLTLYFSPLACSMASRVACYEASLPMAFVRVDTKSARTADGRDFRAINPLGQVPVLEIDGRVRLVENAAILQYLAERAGPGVLGPADPLGRARLQQWLSFVGTELHKTLFTPLLASKDPAVRAFALERAPRRMELLEAHLADREFLLDRFSIADAYAAVVLNWGAHVGLKMDPWPHVAAYRDRILARPTVARALAEELALRQAVARPAPAAVATA
jgi:glutathione S-transferase